MKPNLLQRIQQAKFKLEQLINLKNIGDYEDFYTNDDKLDAMEILWVYKAIKIMEEMEELLR